MSADEYDIIAGYDPTQSCNDEAFMPGDIDWPWSCTLAPDHGGEWHEYVGTDGQVYFRWRTGEALI